MKPERGRRECETFHSFASVHLQSTLVNLQLDIFPGRGHNDTRRHKVSQISLENVQEITIEPRTVNSAPVFGSQEASVCRSGAVSYSVGRRGQEDRAGWDQERQGNYQWGCAGSEYILLKRESFYYKMADLSIMVDDLLEQRRTANVVDAGQR